MKTTLSIDASKARELYNAGCGAVKTILEESFGKDFFEDKKITDRVKTYEDACKELHVKEHPLNVKNGNTFLFSHLPPHTVAYMKLCTIIEALNEGWKPNWGDSDEKKYYPYFKMSPFAFKVSSYEDSDAYAGCGSRLCLKSEELADYCGKQFLDLWKEFIL